MTKPIPFTDSEIRNILTELEIERALVYVMGDESDKPFPKKSAYWCVACNRYLPIGSFSVVIHDNVPHLESMVFDQEQPNEF